MEIERQLLLPAAPEVVFALVADLSVYPTWMALTHAVRRLDEVEGDMPAWDVELRARVGPLARSKRLRMVRAQHEPGRLAVFERAERDGREHAPWVLTARVDPVEGTSSGASAPHAELRMHLFYGGSLWTGAVLQRVLDDEVRRGSEALLALLTPGGSGASGASGSPQEPPDPGR